MAPLEKRQSLIPFPRTGKRSQGGVGTIADASEPEVLFPVYQQMSKFNLEHGPEEPDYAADEVEDEDEGDVNEEEEEEEITEGI